MILVALIVGIFALSATTTLACSCAMPDVPEALNRANAVFIGEVAEIIEPLTSDEKALPPGRFFTIKFKVEKSWKGVAIASREISVLSAQGRYGCFAYPPVSKGERYLVYAEPAYVDGGSSEDWSIITNCTRTSPMRLKLWYEADIDPYEDMKKLDDLLMLSYRFEFKWSWGIKQGSKAED